jgi:pantoate--beta-alanine ligase
MKILRNKKNLIREISGLNNIGFVPTMGALHKGHISLINKAKKKSNKVLVSIFVNPKQFNTKKDFKKYPRKLNKDINTLKKIRVDYLYIPNNKDIYSYKSKIKIHLDKFSRILCGKHRPGHFKGVIDVVGRFLEIIKPKMIFLGLKDFQQLSLIESYLNKNKIMTKVISCPTIRESNGVALSSRNSKLNKKQLLKAGNIYKFIKKNKKTILNKILAKKKSEIINKFLELGADKVEYIDCISLKDKRICTNAMTKFNIFCAYYIKNVRLIDNL